MKLLAKILVNIFALVILVILLSLPTVFSIGTLKFQPIISWHNLTIVGHSQKFSDYLTLDQKEEGGKIVFDLEFSRFAEKTALYQGMIEIKNNSDKVKTLAIHQNQGDAQIFFDNSGQKIASQQISLPPQQTINLSLEAKPTPTKGKSQTAFTLESW